MMKVGVSTACFFPAETEYAVKTLIDAGERNIEIFLNSFSELEKDFLGKIKHCIRSEGVTVTAIHPFTSNLEDMLFSPCQRRIRDMTEFYKKYFSFAAELGAPYVIFHGPNKMFHIPWSFYAEQIAALDQVARESGVRILQENIERCYSRDPELLAYLYQQVPDLGFVLDLKQAVRCQIKISDLVHILNQRIKHVHISDHTDTQDCVLPGVGNLDIPLFIRQLSKVGFKGCLTVEIYDCTNDMCTQLTECTQNLKHIVDTIELEGLV